MRLHEDYEYSITIHTDDRAVLNCLRALSQYSQRTGNNRIPWGGTKESDWKRDDHKVTFQFTEPEYRDTFVDEVTRLLPDDLWDEAERSDNNPPTPVD